MTDLRTRSKNAALALQLLLGRAHLTGVADAGARQLVQFEALKDEIKDGVERMQNYGFSSVPHAGAQVLFVALGGNRDHPVAVTIDDPRYRPTGLQSGEVIIYTDEGDVIKLARGRKIEIETTSLTVKASEVARFETPILEVTGEIIDRCETGGKSMNAMRETYDIHTHDETNSITHVPNQPMGGA